MFEKHYTDLARRGAILDPQHPIIGAGVFGPRQRRLQANRQDQRQHGLY